MVAKKPSTHFSYSLKQKMANSCLSHTTATTFITYIPRYHTSNKHGALMSAFDFKKAKQSMPGKRDINN